MPTSPRQKDEGHHAGRKAARGGREIASRLRQAANPDSVKGMKSTCEIYADESQLGYILKNVLLAVLAQTKMGTEIDIDIGRDGNVVTSYLREGARVVSITHYLAGPGGDSSKRHSSAARSAGNAALGTKRRRIGAGSVRQRNRNSENGVPGWIAPKRKLI